MNIVPDAWKRLVKKMTLNGEQSKWTWWEVDQFHGQYRPDYRQALNISFQGNLSGMD